MWFIWAYLLESINQCIYWYAAAAAAAKDIAIAMATEIRIPAIELISCLTPDPVGGDTGWNWCRIPSLQNNTASLQNNTAATAQFQTQWLSTGSTKSHQLTVTMETKKWIAAANQIRAVITDYASEAFEVPGILMAVSVENRWEAVCVTFNQVQRMALVIAWSHKHSYRGEVPEGGGK